jgi:arsenite methyltransferase
VSRAGTHPHTPHGDDLIGQAAIKELVREAYRQAVGKPSTIAERLYGPDQLAGLPAGAIAQALGVGNPVRAARLKSGDVDTLLAAREVGPTGRAIGLDTLPEMLATAARHATEMGLSNIEWLQGDLEDILLPNASVDVALSNGVVNLSPRKSRVFAEVHRVLRPGGRLAAADIVMDDDLPPEIFTNPAAWAG